MGAAVGNMMATIIATQMLSHNAALIPMVGLMVAAMPVWAACQIRSAQAPAARASSSARIRLRWRRNEYVGVTSMACPFALRRTNLGRLAGAAPVERDVLARPTIPLELQAEGIYPIRRGPAPCGGSARS